MPKKVQMFTTLAVEALALADVSKKSGIPKGQLKATLVDCYVIVERQDGKDLEVWPPILPETPVKTTKENPAITDWSIEAKKSRQWGVLGEVVIHHDAHGLSYEVRHPDGTIGHYDPSEIEPA